MKNLKRTEWEKLSRPELIRRLARTEEMIQRMMEDQQPERFEWDAGYQACGKFILLIMSESEEDAMKALGQARRKVNDQRGAPGLN